MDRELIYLRGYSAGCYKLLFVGQYTKDNGMEFKRIYKQKSINANSFNADNTKKTDDLSTAVNL